MNRQIEWFCYHITTEGLVTAEQCRKVAAFLAKAQREPDLEAFAQAVFDRGLCIDSERLEKVGTLAMQEAEVLGKPPVDVLGPSGVARPKLAMEVAASRQESATSAAPLTPGADHMAEMVPLPTTSHGTHPPGTPKGVPWPCSHPALAQMLCYALAASQTVALGVFWFDQFSDDRCRWPARTLLALALIGPAIATVVMGFSLNRHFSDGDALLLVPLRHLFPIIGPTMLGNSGFSGGADYVPSGPAWRWPALLMGAWICRLIGVLFALPLLVSLVGLCIGIPGASWWFWSGMSLLGLAVPLLFASAMVGSYGAEAEGEAVVPTVSDSPSSDFSWRRVALLLLLMFGGPPIWVLVTEHFRPSSGGGTGGTGASQSSSQPAQTSKSEPSGGSTKSKSGGWLSGLFTSKEEKARQAFEAQYQADARAAAQAMLGIAHQIDAGISLIDLGSSISAAAPVVGGFVATYASKEGVPLYDNMTGAWNALLEARKYWQFAVKYAASGDGYGEVVMAPKAEKDRDSSFQEFGEKLGLAARALRGPTQ